MLHADANAAGAVRTAKYVFPPFIVMERGMTLKEWRQRPRSYGEVLSLIESLTRMLETMHGSGRVHRDLKPGA